MTIKETKTLKSLLEHATHQTLILVDLDNTLFESVSQFGSYEWMSHRISSALSKGEPLEAVLDRIVPPWENMQHKIKTRLIEEKVPSWIDQLQKSGSFVLGLTGRSKTLAEHTREQLKTYQISFTKDLVHDAFNNMHPEMIHSEGTLLIGYKNSKGDALRLLFDQLNTEITKVVFIDDQRRYLDQVQAVLQKLPLEFVGFHFTALEDKFENFDLEVALQEEQLFHEST